MNEHVPLKKNDRSTGLRHLHLTMWLLMLLSTQTWASVLQRGWEITGAVTDGNNEPLIGATVRVVGGTGGTITDFDGKFVISVPDANCKIEFSYIGYETQKIALDGRKSILVKLTEEQNVLEEVVVVGYGTQKKESVVGAVSQVDSKALVNAGTSNITNALAGKLSGVMTMQTSGKPGSNDAEIVIRGVSSWNGNEPLVLLDGVERDFSDIDPNEVETISVLKDASATAVFGARGANGVIIVTTKEGRVGNPKFNISASQGISWATRIPEHVNAETTLNSYNERLMTLQEFGKIVPHSIIQKHVNPANRLEAVLYPDIDWFDLLTKNFANVTNANANLRGGTDFVNYFCSLGLTHESSLFKAYKGENKYHDTNYDYKRFNYRTNLDFKLTQSTKLQLKVGGDFSINNSPGTEPWVDLYAASGVNYPAFFPEWMVKEYPDLYYPDLMGDRLVNIDGAAFPVRRANPYSKVNSGSFTKTNSMKLFSDLIINQKLDFITKGLAFQGKVAFNTNYMHTALKSDYRRQEWSFYPDKIGTGMNPWRRTNEGDNYWHEVPEQPLNLGGLGDFRNDLHYEFALNYSRNFNRHYVTALALMNRNIKNLKSDYPYLYESWVGRVTYDYSHRYQMEVNMGYTGSERFAPSNRFGFFPSGAIGWVLSEEKFFKSALPWINKFKIRYSDGLVGSDTASARWLYVSDYSKSEGNIVEDPGANIYAQWEQARKQDIGIELSFLNNELTVVVDFFKERRDQMLLSPNYNFLVGNSFKDLNLGSLKKHGYEIEIGYRKHTQFGLDYNIKGMLSFSENRIIEKNDYLYAPSYTKVAGTPVGGTSTGQILIDGNYFNSIDDSHIYPSTATSSYMLSPGSFKFMDYNSDGKITTEDRFPIQGSDYAPYIFSLSGGLKYKNFEVSMVWSGDIGKYVFYSGAFYEAFPLQEVRIYENMVNYWRPDNHNADFCGMGSQNSGFAGSGAVKILNSSWNRANYIKLKDLNVSYSFKSAYLKRLLSIEGLKVFFSGNNLLVFTELSMGDPESKQYSEGTYPQMASAQIGFNVEF